MSELRDLYQELILDHNNHPRNFQKMEEADRQAEGDNPLCGDHLILYLKLQDDLVKEISFQGTGCAISTASSSMMTEAVKNHSLSDIQILFNGFHELLTGDPNQGSDRSALGKLQVFAGVREFPVRVKCATLAWHTLMAAVESRNDVVTTE